MAATPASGQAGIGLRQPHYQALMSALPPLGFVEVHSENFFGDGGAALAVLAAVRDHYPVSLHGVGLSLGSACGLEPRHLDKLARLTERIDPVRVSDHACFARGVGPGGDMVHANDLLPVAFTQASLDIMVRNVDAVQTRLRRPILVENLSAYLAYPDDALAEPDFLAELCRRSGCQLLLDLNNLVVNGLNAARRLQPDSVDMRAASEHALTFVQAFPVGLGGEKHLAVFRVATRDNGCTRAGYGRGCSISCYANQSLTPYSTGALVALVLAHGGLRRHLRRDAARGDSIFRAGSRVRER